MREKIVSTNTLDYDVEEKAKTLPVVLASPIVETQQGHTAQGAAFQGHTPADPLGFFTQGSKEN